MHVAGLPSRVSEPRQHVGLRDTAPKEAPDNQAETLPAPFRPSRAFVLRSVAWGFRLKPREALGSHAKAMTDHTLKAAGLSRRRAPARADVLDALHRRLLDADSAEARTADLIAETGRSRSSTRRGRRTTNAAGTVAYQQGIRWRPDPSTGSLVPWASPTTAFLTSIGRALRDALSDLRDRVLNGIASTRSDRANGRPPPKRPPRREPQYLSPLNLCKYLHLPNPYSTALAQLEALMAA